MIMSLITVMKKTTHVAVCVRHAELNSYLLTYQGDELGRNVHVHKSMR